MLNGDKLKLRRVPESLNYQAYVRNPYVAEKTLGYGKNIENWIIRSQAPKGLCSMAKVQRLYGFGW